MSSQLVSWFLSYLFGFNKMVRKQQFHKKIIWQGHMVQKSSRGPKIDHSNDKNQKNPGFRPGWGLQHPPKPNSIFYQVNRISLQGEIIIFPSLASRPCMPSRRSFTTLPTELRALNGHWVSMLSGRKSCLPDMMSERTIFVISETPLIIRPLYNQSISLPKN